MGQSIYTAAERAQMSALKTPFADVMPPLSAEAYAALKADIEQNGLVKSILLDESNNILDGHHRYRACTELGAEIKTEICKGIGSDEDKRVRVLAINLLTRQMSPADRKRLTAEQKHHALRMLAEGRSQYDVAKIIGRPRETVRNWAAALADGPSAHSTKPTVIATKPTANSAKGANEDSKDSRAGTRSNGKMTQDDVVALKQRVVDLHRGGMRISDIVSSVGVSWKTAKRWTDDPDSAPSTRGYNARTKKLDDSDVERLFNDGRSREEIADVLGASLGTVSASLKRLGLGRAGKKARNPLVDHIANADAHASAWSFAADVVVAAASISSTAQVKELTTALNRLSQAVATLKRRLNKDAGKDE